MKPRDWLFVSVLAYVLVHLVRSFAPGALLLAHGAPAPAPAADKDKPLPTPKCASCEGVVCPPYHGCACGKCIFHPEKIPGRGQGS